MTGDEALRRALDACAEERGELIAGDYSTAASRRVEELDEFEEWVWALLQAEGTDGQG